MDCPYGQRGDRPGNTEAILRQFEGETAWRNDEGIEIENVISYHPLPTPDDGMVMVPEELTGSVSDAWDAKVGRVAEGFEDFDWGEAVEIARGKEAKQ